ncbi:hypothetical protein HPB50_003790 [Hyalomma asiaticum]|uniref:Uncharacterized protein n=1 Tax=Hyalomma asiaticum TaxID=266040 RepID=A0ACB7SA85_HYAAI|nr:hypothetical protein HPB50_003790 [Hyalomma asiaticum]
MSQLGQLPGKDGKEREKSGKQKRTSRCWNLLGSCVDPTNSLLVVRSCGGDIVSTLGALWPCGGRVPDSVLLNSGASLMAANLEREEMIAGCRASLRAERAAAVFSFFPRCRLRAPLG